MRGTRRVAIALACATILTTSACGNAEQSTKAPSTTTADHTDISTGDFPAVSAPGVTPTEIRVGGVASVTNPLGGSYGSAFEGVEAYFAMVNASGGIYGRKLVLADKKDDGAVNNKAQVAALIGSDIFAVLPVATLLFNGASDLAATDIPTFGWTINPEWAGTDGDPRTNLFGQTGSYLGFTDPKPNLPYLISKLGKHKLGVLGYNVPQSSECAEGVRNSIKTYGPAIDATIAYFDTSLSYGDKNLAVQVGKMADAGVDIVTTCMDTNGVVTLATEMDKQGLDAIQYLPNGYDHDFVEQYGDLFEGSVVRTDFAVWELPRQQQPKGLKDFLAWMAKQGSTPTENAAAAWINAATFVAGLRAAGPDFSRQKVIDAINAMTDFNADGMIAGVDWSTQHTGRAEAGVLCDMDVVIEKSAFVPKFSKPGKPFLCVDGRNTSKLTATNEA